MQHYQNYQATDFILDLRFQQWVRNPTPEKDAYWRKVRLLFPHQESAIEEARQTLQSLKFESLNPEDIPTEAILSSILTQINAEKADRSKYQIGQFSLLKITASVFLLVSLLIAYRTWDAQRLIQAETAFGEIKELRLPDGSWVTLNANSSIRYRNNWSKRGEREVWLGGEAYFHVEKQKQADNDSQLVQFVVHTDELDVKVVGTEFNVYQRRGTTEVALTEGKVRVNVHNPDLSEEVTMKPGELLTYSAKQSALVTTSEDPATHSAWQHRQLIFNGEPLREVAQQLEEFFGYEIVFPDTDFANNRFHGAVPLDDLEVLISTFEKAYSIKIKQRERQLIFSSGTAEDGKTN